MGKTNSYSNEKVIFGEEGASLSMFDLQRQFIFFFKKELGSFGKKKKLKLLDLGCGAGAKTKTLQDFFPNFTFFGCDISKNAIRIAKKNYPNIVFIVADAQKLPFKTNSFDIVIANSVLDHLEFPKMGIGEAFRVLKKGGTFLFTDPLENGNFTIHKFFIRKIKGFREFRKDRLGHRVAFSKESLLKLAKSSGFKIESLSFDWFFLRQTIDVIYYPILALFGRDPEFTVNKIISTKNSFVSKAFSLGRSVLAFFENLESEILRGFPNGFFIYVKAKKL